MHKQIIPVNGALPAHLCFVRQTLASLPPANTFCSAAELQVLSNFADRRKQQYLLGRYCAKQALVQALDCEATAITITAGVFSQPVISGIVHTHDVSIAHTDDAAIAVAFPTTHPMGVDLEAVVRQKDHVIAERMTNDELSLLANIDNGLLLGWTIKEALSKALRCGFGISFRLLAIADITAHGNGFAATFRHLHQYHSVSWQHDQHIISLVVPKSVNVLAACTSA